MPEMPAGPFQEGGLFSEEELARIERERDPEMIPRLVSALRERQHEVEKLRLSLDVARRDREELRTALIQAREG